VPKQPTSGYSCNNNSRTIARQQTSKHDSPEDLNYENRAKRDFFVHRQQIQRKSKTTYPRINKQHDPIIAKHKPPNTIAQKTLILKSHAKRHLVVYQQQFKRNSKATNSNIDKQQNAMIAKQQTSKHNSPEHCNSEKSCEAYFSYINNKSNAFAKQQILE